MATLAGLIVGAHWRYAFLVGVLPALLVLWVRSSVSESERWREKATVAGGRASGSFGELLLHRQWGPRACLGMLLAAVGLATFWGVTVAGQDLAKELLLRNGVAEKEAIERAKFAYGFIETAGGGLGLLAFGPICVRLGRKRAFALMQLAALIIVPITCYLPKTYWQLLLLLPVFGFLTLSIHAGFAIYFPELFPTAIRATAQGFCYNFARFFSAAGPLLAGVLTTTHGSFAPAIATIGSVYLIGLVILIFARETHGQALPD